MSGPWIERLSRDPSPELIKYYNAFIREVERLVNEGRPTELQCLPEVTEEVGYLLYSDLTLGVLGYTAQFPNMADGRILSVHRRLLKETLRLDADAVKAAG